MKTFSDVNEMWLDMLGSAMDEGRDLPSRDGPSREVLGWCGRLTDARRGYLTLPGRRFSPSYAGAEVLWYLGMSADTAMIRRYAPSYEEWTEPDGEMYGGYGKRLHDQPGFVREFEDAVGLPRNDADQLTTAIRLLREKPNTRQCVITLWDSGDLVHAVLGDKRNVPCTVLFQLLSRDGALHMIAYMRSNDAWLGAPYDLWSFTCIQVLVAEAVGLQVGSYTHVVGSLHVYNRHYDKARRMLAERSPADVNRLTPITHDATARLPIDEVRGWLAVERALAEQGNWAFAEAELRGSPDTLLRDCFAMAASKHAEDPDAFLREHVRAPRLRPPPVQP